MVTFDRIKVSADINCVETFQSQYFHEQCNKNFLNSASFQAINSNFLCLPVKLEVRFNFSKNELVLDIPAKVLKDDYYKLLSTETIEQVIRNLQAEYLIAIDFNRFIKTAMVLSADVTKDITVEFSRKKFIPLINLLKNDNQWKGISKINGITFSNNVSTKNRKILLEIYGKSHEINLSRNYAFLNWLDDKEKLQEYFRDKTRVELKLRSAYLLRSFFETDDLSLKNILCSEKLPISSIMSNIFEIEKIREDCNEILIDPAMSMADLKNYLVVQHCDFKLDKVRAVLNQHYKQTTNKRAALQPYKKIILEHNSNEGFKNNEILRFFNTFGILV
jgi:hypothetical protein